MLLIGIVKKNAIMMVDFALEAQRHGNLTPQEAIFQACLLRFRPIMMTTLARCLVRCRWYCRAATARSCGNPGITIVGGLVMSQLLRCIPRRWCISFSTVCGCVFRVNLNKR